MQHASRHMAMSMAQYGMGFLLSLKQPKKRGQVPSSYFLPREKLNFLAHKYLFKLKLCDSPFRPSSNFVYHFPCYCGNILHDFMEPAIELLFPRLLIYNVCKTYKNTFRIKILCIFFSLTDICTRFVTL